LALLNTTTPAFNFGAFISDEFFKEFQEHKTAMEESSEKRKQNYSRELCCQPLVEIEAFPRKWFGPYFARDGRTWAIPG